MTNDHLNEYQYQQSLGYEMAINELKPLLREILKVVNKPNQTRDKIAEYVIKNPKSSWQKISTDLGLSSNQLIAHHLPRIKLINSIKRVIND